MNAHITCYNKEIEKRLEICEYLCYPPMLAYKNEEW